MKLAALLFILAFVFAFLAPRFGDLFSGVGVKLPQFVWSKSPPRVYEINITNSSRMISVVLFAAAVVVFFVSRRVAK